MMILQVDHLDRPIGPIEKLEAHQKGILHRAFSLFIFRTLNGEQQLLLQKRAFGKYHSGGLWTNTCCGHPDPGLSGTEIISAAKKRLQEELGFETPLTFIKSFYYKSDVNFNLIEHEIDHLFFGQYDGPIHPNPNEVAEYGWFDLAWIKQECKERPEKFTVWFLKILDTLKELTEP